MASAALLKFEGADVPRALEDWKAEHPTHTAKFTITEVDGSFKVQQVAQEFFATDVSMEVTSSEFLSQVTITYSDKDGTQRKLQAEAFSYGDMPPGPRLQPTPLSFVPAYAGEKDMPDLALPGPKLDDDFRI
ncbi:MAG: hypothetical protein SP1CHLAM54_12260 [Chlamydiia bacterium]|nr:hypothetical protein [Chlamydiia bacterium]MCH9616124.1 hypothetical protein [Chlamydiia bacterium]MCH9629453.1 hypothetical protein [Chlamydiia bacterium]